MTIKKRCYYNNLNYPFFCGFKPKTIYYTFYFFIQVLNYFPKDMKADICVHLGRETFTKQPAFRFNLLRFCFNKNNSAFQYV